MATMAPASAQDMHRQGLALFKAGRPAEAVAALIKASRLAPDDAEIASALGVALRKLGAWDAAAAAYRRALTLRPDSAGTWSSLGNVLKDKGDMEGAIAAHHRAVEIAPEAGRHWHNLGIALANGWRSAEAIPHFRRAVALAPDDGAIAWDLARALLAVGDLKAGWQAYEARWRLPGQAPRPVAGPEWDGKPFSGRRLFLYCEQGFGDTVFSLRYLPQVKALGGEMILECQPPLVPLATGIAGVDRIIPKGEPRPEFDLCLPLMSLPRLFSQSLDTVGGAPYLATPPARRGSLDALFAEAAGAFKVGIVWSGSVTFQANANRSVPVETLLAGVGGIPGVRLYSLQKGPPEQELNRLPSGHGVVDLAPYLKDFGDTAEALRHLDLVVMTDSAVAHLCGALGRPVWVLLGLGSYWLWLEDGERCPWYASMRLVRQSRPNDWWTLMKRVRAELTGHAAARAT